MDAIFNKFVDGEVVPHQGQEPRRPATNFQGRFTMQTGKSESEWVGPILLQLAAQGGRWNMVPWRLLRNTYMGYGKFKRLMLRKERKATFLKEEPVTVWVPGRGRPPVTFLIGITDLFDRRLVRAIVQGGETYFVPTDAMLKLVTPEATFRDFITSSLEEILGKNGSKIPVTVSPDAE